MVVGAVFNQGERVDVIGTSKGHGFQGVVKRHHFGGGVATHGSMFHRAPGSIGASSYPSRVAHVEAPAWAMMQWEERALRIERETKAKPFYMPSDARVVNSGAPFA